MPSNDTDWSLLDCEEIADEVRTLAEAPLRLRRVRFTRPFSSRGLVAVDGETIRMTLDDVVDAPRDERAAEPPPGMVSRTVPKHARRAPSEYAFVAAQNGRRRG